MPESLEVPEFAEIPPRSLDRYEPLLGPRQVSLDEIAARTRELLGTRAVWHVNSTLQGGGVAEMLQSFLPYVKDAGIDTRWVVPPAPPEFFEVTKRIHNRLHGHPGDNGSLDTAERLLYEDSLREAAEHLRGLVRAGDVVYLHDPQTAGLIPAMKDAGTTVVWRCHVGTETGNEWTESAHRFLGHYVNQADASVFSRREYVWPNLAGSAWIIPPAIDAFSPKNEEIDDDVVEEIVGAIGLGPEAPSEAPIFTRADDTPGRVERRAEILQDGTLPVGAPLLVQVSRWDRLKDHLGLLHLFSEYLADTDLHLALVGPASGAVADDPEGVENYDQLVAAFHQLPEPIRRKVHIVNLPMDDLEENGAMVNAIQRRASILVQKSLAEGFGLTVTEAMWKSKPIVASRVGGIQDQIEDGQSGILIDDPSDLAAFADAIASLHADPDMRAALGSAAKQTVASRYLVVNSLICHLGLMEGLVDPDR